jgi:hypothetical protein
MYVKRRIEKVTAKYLGDMVQNLRVTYRLMSNYRIQDQKWIKEGHGPLPQHKESVRMEMDSRN